MEAFETSNPTGFRWLLTIWIFTYTFTNYKSKSDMLLKDPVTQNPQIPLKSHWTSAETVEIHRVVFELQSVKLSVNGHIRRGSQEMFGGTRFDGS